MRLFVKMNSNFTSTFFGDHRGLVVVETNFKFVTCRANILHITFLAHNQVNDIFRFTVKNETLPGRKNYEES